MDDHTLFFQNPQDFGLNQKIHSTLYLLRRDILTCLGIDPSTRDPLTCKATFPAIMAIMAGVDLLAKFYYTDVDCNGNRISDRFKNFIEKYIDNQNMEVLYQLRNSLLHSFGLYSIDRKNNIYKFSIDPNPELTTLVRRIDDNTYVVSLYELFLRFENAIESYRNDLLEDVKLEVNFIDMFQKYGSITFVNQQH